MKREGIVDIKLERLRKQIDEIREVLNEICVSSEGIDIIKERLIISQYLDELIVEYMNQVASDKDDKVNNQMEIDI